MVYSLTLQIFLQYFDIEAILDILKCKNDGLKYSKIMLQLNQLSFFCR